MITLELSDTIKKVMRTKSIRKRLTLIYDKYQIDSKEMFQILYESALKSRWVEKFRGQHNGEFFRYIINCVFHKCSNLLRHERKKRERATDSYEVLTEQYDEYIPSELKYDCSETMINLLAIEQCARKSLLQDDEIELILQGYTTVEVANRLKISVNSLRNRMVSFKKLLVSEGLSLDII